MSIPPRVQSTGNVEIVRYVSIRGRERVLVDNGVDGEVRLARAGWSFSFVLIQKGM